MGAIIFFSCLPAVDAQLDHYTAASKNLETILTDLRKKSEGITEQNSVLSVKNGILHKKLWAMQQELKSRYVEKQELQAEFRRLDDCLSNEITIVQLLEKKLSGLKLISGHHDENDSHLRAEIDRKKNEVESLRKEVQSLNKNIDSLDNQLQLSKQGSSHGWEVKRNELNDLLVESKKRVEKKKKELENRMKDPSSPEYQMSSLSKLQDELIQKISDLKYGKNTNEEQSILQRRKEKDLATLTRDVEKLIKQRKDLQNTLDLVPPANPQEERMPPDFKKAANQLRESIKSDKSLQRRLKDRIEQLEDDITTEQIEIVHLRNDRRLQNIGVRAVWEKNEDKRAKLLSESRALPEEKRKELASQQNEKEKITDIINGLSQDQLSLNEKIDQIKNDIQLSRNEEIRITGASQFMSERRKEDYNIINDEIDYLKSQQQELKEFLALIQDQLNDDKKISDAFAREEKKLDSDIQLLKGENETLLKQLIKLKSSSKEFGLTPDGLTSISEEKVGKSK